jgi:hypothetical protein
MHTLTLWHTHAHLPVWPSTKYWTGGLGLENDEVYHENLYPLSELSEHLISILIRLEFTLYLYLFWKYENGSGKSTIPLRNVSNVTKTKDYNLNVFTMHDDWWEWKYVTAKLWWFEVRERTPPVLVRIMYLIGALDHQVFLLLKYTNGC